MTAGPQQFTIAGDTDHRNEAIHSTINADIPTMARNGVRHIMIEYTAEPMSEWEKRIPALQGAKTWDERREIIEQEHSRIYDEKQKIIQQHLAGIDPDTDKAAWQAAFDKGYKAADDALGGRRSALIDLEQDIRTHELLERVYAKPPAITDAEIREAAKDFISASASDPKKSADNFAELLIQSRNNGIQVHFTGDRTDYALKEELRRAERALQDHTEANRKYADHYERLSRQPGYIIPPEDMEQQVIYMREAARLTNAVNAAQQRINDGRDDPVKEQQRVDRIIAAANGERSVVVWGSAHSSKPNDFNEMIDARLQASAAARGAPTPPPTTVIDIMGSRNDHATRQHLMGPDEPDARFFIEEQELEITPSGSSRLSLLPKGGVAFAPIEQQLAELMTRKATSATQPAPTPDQPDLTNAAPAQPRQPVTQLAWAPDSAKI